MIEVWQYYEYNLESEYVRFLNMLGLHMVLNNISEYLSSSEYASVT